MEDLAKAIFDPGNIIMVLGALGMFLGSLAIAMPYLQRDQLKPRVKAVAERREELRQSLQAQNVKAVRPGRKEALGMANKLLIRLNLRTQIDDKELRNRLAQAGWRGQGPAVMFVTARLVLPIVMALAAAILFMLLGVFKLSFRTQIASVLGRLGLGYYLPNVMVKNAATKPQEGPTL